MVEIRQVASIVRAPLFKDESVVEGIICSIISIKDFPFAGFLPAPQKQIRLDSRNQKIHRFAVKENDVLLTVVGTIGKITIASKDDRMLRVPATNIVRIKFHESPKENAIALYVYVKSPAGQAAIQDLIHGTSIPIVTKGQISSMKIPVPSQETWNSTQRIWNEESRLYQEGRRLLKESQSVFSTYTGGTEKRNPYLISP